MGVLDDVRKWLKEIPIWQELEKVPDRMTLLEQRMTALEDRLEPRPGETCPACGEHAMRRERSGRILGEAGKRFRRDSYKCQACGDVEEREVRF